MSSDTTSIIENNIKISTKIKEKFEETSETIQEFSFVSSVNMKQKVI
jgi:hypothetical protein